MKKLSYAVLKEQGYDGYLLESAPERVLQFGEGNFLRAFVDYFIDELNEKAGFNSKVVLCQPIAPDLDDRFNEQEGLYTLFWLLYTSPSPRDTRSSRMPSSA